MDGSDKVRMNISKTAVVEALEMYASIPYQEAYIRAFSKRLFDYMKELRDFSVFNGVLTKRTGPPETLALLITAMGWSPDLNQVIGLLEEPLKAVSYTHLTLPTICSV